MKDPVLILSNDCYHVNQMGKDKVADCDNCTRTRIECVPIKIYYAPTSHEITKCQRCNKYRENPESGCSNCYDTGTLVSDGIDWKCSNSCRNSCDECYDKVPIHGQYVVCKSCLTEAQSSLGQFVSTIEYNAMG